LNIQIPIPTQIERVLIKDKVSVKIKTYEELNTFLGQNPKSYSKNIPQFADFKIYKICESAVFLCLFIAEISAAK
jgi:hypothetical protein